MGQVFDGGDHFLGEARADSFQKVLVKLLKKHPHADKVTIGHGDPPVATTEMPRYKCHKEVWALQILVIEQPSGLITPVDQSYAPFTVSAEYLRKHQPHVGGYYVVYKDGYASFSPAEAFEDGYTRIKAQNPVE